MNRFECPHEQDVLDTLMSRRWPDRCDPELRAHVASCVLCTELAAVAGALLDEEANANPIAGLPPASLVWWRAQLRAREAAGRAALRPIRLAQYAAFALAVPLLVLAVLAAAPHAWASITAFASGIPHIDPQATMARVAALVPTFDTTGASQAALTAFASRGVQLAAGAWLVLVPVALYLAFARD